VHIHKLGQQLMTVVSQSAIADSWTSQLAATNLLVMYSSEQKYFSLPRLSAWYNLRPEEMKMAVSYEAASFIAIGML